MTVTQLERWVGKPGVAEFFDVSIRVVSYWTARGMPSELIAGQRKYRLSECEEWVLRHGKRGAA